MEDKEKMYTCDCKDCKCEDVDTTDVEEVEEDYGEFERRIRKNCDKKRLRYVR